MTCQRPFAKLAGYDSGNLFGLQPAKQPAKLCTHDEVAGETTKERFYCIQHDTLGIDRIKSVPQPDEQPFKVILARLFYLASLDMHMVNHQFLPLYQFVQVPAERSDILRQLLCAFFKRHKTPGSLY
jgi:hypothetical protein